MTILFLTGHRKSGTTVLHRLFDGHPGINLFPVDLSIFYAYFPCFVDKARPEACRHRLRVILEKTLSHLDGRQIPGTATPFRLGALVDNFENRLPDSRLDDRAAMLAALLRGWSDCTGADTDKPWVVKETSQAVFADIFFRTDYDVRFVNIVRDPRDNYAALKSGVEGYYSRFGEDDRKTLASLINRARMDFLAARVQEEKRPDKFLTVKFEALASDTKGTMSGILEHCGLIFDESAMNPTFLGEPFVGNSHEEIQFTGVSDENVGRWKQRISSFEAKVIEFWLRDVMLVYGYEPEFPIEQALESFASFYEWYNCEYFYSDSFENRKET